MSERAIWRFNVCGWLLFVFSALGYCWASLRADDYVSFTASLFFLGACLVFLVPMFANPPGDP